MGVSLLHIWGVKPTFHRSNFGAAALAVLWLNALAAGGALQAQTAVNVTDTTGWNPWVTASNTIMSDAYNDQQTGQGADDFVGDSTHAGFFQKAGTIGGVDHLLLRARMQKFDGADQWGNGGNWGVGIDVQGDGSIDLVMMLSENSGNPNNRTRTITFGDPGAGANTGPSTTTWTFPTQTAINLTVNTTYDVMQAGDGSTFGGNADAFVSFAVSFANLQAAIRAYTPETSFTVNYTTRLSFISFTSTQNNSLNQDLFGTTGNTSSTQTWAQLGAMTGPMNSYGIVPEPSTYAQMAAMLGTASLLWWRRRRNASVASRSPGVSVAQPLPVRS